jgi:hypothetical protein
MAVNCLCQMLPLTLCHLGCSKQCLHIYIEILLSASCFLWYFRTRFQCDKLLEGIQVAFISICDISQEQFSHGRCTQSNQKQL